jgi:hypothetical protein
MGQRQGDVEQARKYYSHYKALEAIVFITGS